MPKRNRYYVEPLHETNPHAFGRSGEIRFKYGIFCRERIDAGSSAPIFRTKGRGMADEIVRNLNRGTRS